MYRNLYDNENRQSQLTMHFGQIYRTNYQHQRWLNITS